MDNMKTMAKESVPKSLRENKSLLSLADDLTTENLRYGKLVAEIRDVLWSIKHPEMIDGAAPVEEDKIDKSTWIQVAFDQAARLRNNNNELDALVEHLRQIRG